MSGIEALFIHLLNQFFKNCVYRKQSFIDKLVELFGENDITITVCDEDKEFVTFKIIYGEYVVYLIFNINPKTKVVTEIGV